MIAAQLDVALRAAGLPIVGVSIGRRDDKATWRVDWDGDPTQEQEAAALAVIEGLDPALSPPALTPAQKLARVGLTVDEMRALLR